MRARRLLLVAWVCLCSSPTAASSDPGARLHVSLKPDRPGAETTIGFAVQVLPSAGQQLPPALTGVDLRYPRSIGIAVSGLGLLTCSERTLELQGPSGCPAEARMGVGSALTAIPLGPVNVYEQTVASIVRAPEAGNRIAMYFNVEGDTPVLAQLVLPGVLAATNVPAFESLDIQVPLVEGIVGGSYVAVTNLQATLGPRSLTYYEPTSHGFIPYRPRGILLPNRCPAGGYRFTVRLSFVTRQSASAGARVGCG
jgi:hypothetical protein